jgi:hypothetical protein
MPAFAAGSIILRRFGQARLADWEVHPMVEIRPLSTSFVAELAGLGVRAPHRCQAAVPLFAGRSILGGTLYRSTN